MNSMIAVLLTASLCLGASSALFFESIEYQFASTARVVNYLCNKGKDTMTDKLAMDFFNCYDAAPTGGRAIYTDCQIKTNGAEGVMNTTAGIRQACKGLKTFPIYATCLAINFKKANIDLTQAITSVNMCEEEVLGIGKYSGKN